MKQKGILALIITVFVTLFITGCPLGIDVTGDWLGPLTIDQQPGDEFELEASLEQDGSDITGDAALLYSGIPVTTYDVECTIDGSDITGTLIGSSVEIYDIEIEATLNSAGDEIEGDFVIPESEATGEFTLVKD